MRVVVDTGADIRVDTEIEVGVQFVTYIEVGMMFC
jgi:hypothetical protein